MSYSRWSTTIGFDFDLAFPGLDIFDQLNAFYSVTAERRLCLLQSQRAFFSDWYVYWDAPQSKAELGRKGQVLAIYGPCSWDRSPFYSYDVLKFVATRERWREIDGYADGAPTHEIERQGRWKQGGGMVGRYTRGESAGSALRYL